MAAAGDQLISVVVPTQDRPAALAACLTALSAQTAADRLEIVVVDDGSRASDEIVSIVAGHPRARLVHSQRRGPAAARNEGFRNARGSLICFTDDDCVPEPEWAERLAAALGAGADAAAGTTRFSRAGSLAEAAEIIIQAAATGTPPADGDLLFAASNNLACTRATFDTTPFDESYPLAAGEDRDWCARLIEQGLSFRHVRDANVVHDHRLTLRSFCAQQTRYGAGAFRFRRNRHRPLEPPGFYLRLVRRGFGKGIAVGMLVAAAQVLTAAGFVRAWLSTRERAARPAVLRRPR